LWIQYVLYTLLALAVFGLASAVVLAGRELKRELTQRHDVPPAPQRGGSPDQE